MGHVTRWDIHDHDRSGEIDQHQGDGARAIGMFKHGGGSVAGRGSEQWESSAHGGAATIKAQRLSNEGILGMGDS
jgi:hypothetical protein